MNRLKGFSKMWSLLILAVVFMAGCSGNNDSVEQNVSAKAITAYSIGGEVGVINEAAKTIAVTMPYSTNKTALYAKFTTSGSDVMVGTVAQASTATPNNFTNPVAYIVTAPDGSTATYTVTVTVPSSTDKVITAYSLGGIAGIINETDKTILVAMPSGTDATNLIATFTSSSTSVKVGTVVQVSASTANNFAAQVAYEVTAADSSTATYTVTVTVASNTAKAITAYSLGGVAGTINESARTISVAMPGGTNVTGQIATFTTSGTGVMIGTVGQTSATTPNDFTAPVTYVVSAANGTSATYTVTVTVGAVVVTPKGPAPVLLGSAGNYAILATSSISTVPASVITGDVGLSPAATSFITGFSLTLVGTTAAISPQVIGNLYGADLTTPTSSNLTTAVTNMGTAYTDAAGRPTPDFLNTGAGEIGGQTLIPGLYNWTTGVTVSSNVTLSGGPLDVWIFQIPGNLTMSAARNITLSGGALAKNIFWQVAGEATIGSTSHFEGIILSKTAITLGTGASINGRLLAQTAIHLDTSTVTAP